MATAIFEGVKITGMACAVPTHIENVCDFSEVFGKESVEKFIATTGVRERRRVGAKQTNSDLCYAAAERLIAHKGYEKDSFDGIILVTQTPDYLIPATSHILHKRLGFSKDCMAFDINLGCSGFVYGLNIAASMIKAHALRRILLCCGEADALQMPKGDKSIDMLFGDAGSAMIVEAGDDMIHTLLKADGEGYQTILTPGVSARVKVDYENFDYHRIRSTMDGGAVFEFAISQVPRSFKEYFKAFGGTIDDFDYCVFHQANLFMLEHIRKKIKLPPEKMPISMDRYGNTSSVTIPLTITDLCQRESVKERIHFITSGFGVGLSWGIADFTMDRKDILPVIETDDYFREAFVGNPAKGHNEI